MAEITEENIIFTESESKLDTIMQSLEKGVETIFTSEQYHIYLNTMAKFHNYSFNNTLLIAMQRPDATLVAGYQTWQKKFQRHVKRGEKGIKIIAPAPVKETREVEKVDEETQEIIIGEDGQPETEIVERILPRFRVTTVFDVSQTDGEPLPMIGVNELDGEVIIYEDFMKELEKLSPVPFQFIEIENGAKGYYSNSEKYIAIQNHMSQAQTMKTAVHETAHAILHDRDIMEESGIIKDQMTKEVEAESVAYVVCNHFGLDTSDYSFGYIAGWSSNKELSELRNSMDTIRVTSSQLISDITNRLQELQKNREQGKEKDLKVINSDDVVVKFSAEFDSEWEIIKITNMSRDDVGKMIYDMAALEEEKWDGDYITYLEQRGAEITLIASSMSSEESDLEDYDFEFTADANPPVIEGEKVIDERTLFSRTDDSYAIYQYDHTDGDWGYEFMGLDFIENMGLSVDGKDYRMLYMSTLEKTDTLDTLYEKFNIGRPKEFKGHPMSTSDVVIMKRNGDMKAYYVDNIGFKELPGFALQRANLLNVFIDQLSKKFHTSSAEETLENKEGYITASTTGYEADGHEGTWYTIDQREYQGEKFFQMRHERYGADVADIILAENGTLVAEEVWNGFDSGVQEVIAEYQEENAIMDQKQSEHQNKSENFPDVDKQKEKGISFYAAECMEFPDLGVLYEHLTLDEAIKKYESIPAERMNAVKGIGFELEDGSIYEGKYDLMHLGRVDRENVEMVQHYKENSSIMKALDLLEKYCEEQSRSVNEIANSDKKQDTSRKKKENNIQVGLHR